MADAMNDATDLRNELSVNKTGGWIRGSLNANSANEKVHRLKQENVTDALTGVFNRKKFNLELKKLGKSPNQEFGIILIDIDHFKAFNDTYGHLGGDEALKRVSIFLAGNTRASDVLARYGGEEFVLIYKGTEQIEKRAESLRSAIEESHKSEQRRKTDQFSTVPITISVGVAIHIKESSLTPMEVVNNADKALYKAKQSGRNRVVVSKFT